MKILGVDTDAVDSGFSPPSAGRTMILDGDSLCYVVAAQCAKLDTAIRRFKQGVLELMFITKCSSARIHLTAHDSAKFGRYRVIATKPYQGNRNGKSKPALLEAVREAAANPKNWLPNTEVFLHRDVEADDACMRDSYELMQHGVLVSEDKDLRSTPYPWYDSDLAKVDTLPAPHWVELGSTKGGKLKLIGRGHQFFWAQMLAGDTADNVRGLQKYNGRDIGAAQAVKVLSTCNTLYATVNTVLDLYRAIDQNPIPEGWLLWLQRSHDDTFVKYLQQQELTPENKAFIKDCLEREWYWEE